MTEIIDSRNIVELLGSYHRTPALLTAKEVITYGELQNSTVRAGYALLQICQKSECIVCLIGEHVWEWIALFYAALWIGKPVLPLPRNIPPKELITILNNFRNSTVISDTDRKLQKNIRHVHLKEIFAGGVSGRDERLPLQHSEIALLIRTSGSKGVPKLVALTFENNVYNALGAHQNLPFAHGDRWLLSLPLYHISGFSLLFRALLCGGTLVLDSWKSLLTGNPLDITHVSFVPTQLYRYLQDENAGANLQKLKAILLGGAPASATMLQDAYAKGLPIRTTYGLTETASQVTTLPSIYPVEKLYSSGVVLPFRKVEIIDDQICVAGPIVSKGYFVQGQLQPLPEIDGYFATGDLGYRDSDGYLYVRGRRDNMFLCGGVKIYPEEIERELLQIPGVVQACVVPVDDPKYGKRPVAFLEWSDARIKKDELHIKERLSDSLEKFKIPVHIFEFPAQFKGYAKPPRKALERYANQGLNRDE